MVLLAVPTSENRGLIGARELQMMRPGSTLLLISRSHLVDFDALTDALYAHHVQAAIDVFPEGACLPIIRSGGRSAGWWSMTSS